MDRKEKIKDYLLITVSSFLMALSVNFFLKEKTLAPGGITGLSVVLNKAFGIPVDFVYFGISIPLLLMGIFVLGKSFGLKTLYITVTSPIFLRIIPQTHITDNLFIASIVGGLLVGTGIGIALLRDCATGGTDLIATLIHKLIPKVKIPVILFILDGSIVISSGFISKNYSIALYSLLSLLVIIKTIDIILKKPWSKAF